MRLHSTLCLILSLICASAVAAPPVEIRFQATVLDVVMLNSFSGTVIPVHSDPRFAVSLKIEKCTPAVEAIAKGEVVIFAIHSPTRLFQADNAKGSVFWFSVKRESTDGRVLFHDLHIEKSFVEPPVQTSDSPVPAP